MVREASGVTDVGTWPGSSSGLPPDSPSDARSAPPPAWPQPSSSGTTRRGSYRLAGLLTAPRPLGGVGGRKRPSNRLFCSSLKYFPSGHQSETINCKYGLEIFLILSSLDSP